jgi:cell division protein FtsQ
VARRNDYRRRKARLRPFLAAVGRQVVRLCHIGLFLIVLTGVSLGLIAAYNWVVTTDYLNVETVTISGNRRLDKREILRMAEVSPGDNILALSIGTIEERLSRNPWVKRTIVRRELPDRLVIKLTERDAEYWVQQGEAVYYADETGRSIAPVGVDHFVSLPLVDLEQGNSRQKTILTELTEIFSKKSFPFSLAEVGWITFLCDEIIQIHLFDRSLSVRLSSEKLKENVLSLRRVWRDLVSRQELRQVNRIMALDGDCWVRFSNGQDTE